MKNKTKTHETIKEETLTKKENPRRKPEPGRTTEHSHEQATVRPWNMLFRDWNTSAHNSPGKTRVRAALRVSSPADPAEREADRESQQAVSMKEADISAEQTADVQASPASGGIGVSTAVESGINSLSGGQQLSNTELSFFGPRLGADFSGVRVHNTDQAHSLADSINARAFTRGSDIVFAKGEYASGTSEGKKLLAHELVHVVQGGKGENIVQRNPYYQPDTKQKQEADEQKRNEYLPEDIKQKVNRIRKNRKVNLYHDNFNNTIISDSDYEYFFNKKESEIIGTQIAVKMDCIAYLTTTTSSISLKDNYAIYYLLGGVGQNNENQWENLLSTNDPYVYHYAVRPFILAALNKLPSGFTFIRSGPTKDDIKTFMRALYGLNNIKHVSRADMPVNKKMPMVYGQTKGNELAMLILKYQPLVIEDLFEQGYIVEETDIKQLAIEGTGSGIFAADFSVMNKMLDSASVTAIKGVSEYLEGNQSKGKSMVINSAYIINYVLDAWQTITTTIKKNRNNAYEFIFNRFWSLVELSPVLKSLGSNIKNILFETIKNLLNIDGNFKNAKDLKSQYKKNFQNCIIDLNKETEKKTHVVLLDLLTDFNAAIK